MTISNDTMRILELAGVQVNNDSQNISEDENDIVIHKYGSDLDGMPAKLLGSEGSGIYAVVCKDKNGQEHRFTVNKNEFTRHQPNVKEEDFDYGDQDVEGDGKEVDPDTYIWKGPHTPQRIVKGMMGDNALVTEIHSKILSEYKEFISEDDDRDNAEGNQSPLTNAERINFDKDPFHGEEAVDDGSRSPLSTIERYPALD